MTKRTAPDGTQPTNKDQAPLLAPEDIQTARYYLDELLLVLSAKLRPGLVAFLRTLADFATQNASAWRTLCDGTPLALQLVAVQDLADKAKLPPESRAFLDFIVRRKRLGIIPLAFKAPFQDSGTLFFKSAAPMDAKDLHKALGKAGSNSDAENISFQHDADLLRGWIVTFGGRQLDMSLRTAFKGFEKAVLKEV